MSGKNIMTKFAILIQFLQTRSDKSCELSHNILPLMPKLGLINKCYIFFGICYLICWPDRLFIIILDKLSELILPLSEG
jgi:hypothetical protein